MFHFSRLTLYLGYFCLLTVNLTVECLANTLAVFAMCQFFELNI